MSIHLMSLVWEVKFPTHVQKLVMLKLADHSSDDGESIFPAVGTLAYQIGCDERSVQRATKAIEGSGLIRKVHVGGKGSKDTNRYEIDVDLLIQLATHDLQLNGDSASIQAVESEGGTLPPLAFRRVARVLKRVAPRRPEGGTMPPKPSLNHQEPSSLVPADAGATENVVELKKKAWSEQRRHSTSFVITCRDPQWKRWVQWFQANRPDRVGELIAAGRMTAFGSRWPDGDVTTPRIDSPQLSEQSKRMLGGDA